MNITLYNSNRVDDETNLRIAADTNTREMFAIPTKQFDRATSRIVLSGPAWWRAQQVEAEDFGIYRMKDFTYFLPI